MQAYDFYALFQKYGCNMQFGGDDSVEQHACGNRAYPQKIGRRCRRDDYYAVVNSKERRWENTVKGVWFDPNKTSPFDFISIEKCCGCRRFEMYSYAYVPSA